MSKEVVCKKCGDTHSLWRSDLEREVMCTYCPVPCQTCRVGAYCRKTPCSCPCHSNKELTNKEIQKYSLVQQLKEQGKKVDRQLFKEALEALLEELS